MLNPVSIIVPIKNRSDLLPNLISNLSNLDYSEFEIIIVDDCSTDDTEDVLKKSNVRYISLKQPVGSANARNIGIEMANYEIIALTDSDCFVSKNWLRNLVPYLENYDIVGGRVIFCDEDEEKLNPFNLKTEMVLGVKTSLNFLNTSNLIFTKRIWESSGGFQNFRIEDLEFSWRMLKKGFTLFYSHKGVVVHHGNRNPFQNIKKYLKYGNSYSKIAIIHDMSLVFKPERILDKTKIIGYLKLIFISLIPLLLLLLNRIIITNNYIDILLVILSLLVILYPLVRLAKKINVIFKIYKFTMMFSITYHFFIYLFKRK